MIDGPFAETKELVAGYWILQCKSLAETIEWIKRCPNPHNENSEIEIRQLFELDDFGTSEAVEHHRRLGEDIGLRSASALVVVIRGCLCVRRVAEFTLFRGNQPERVRAMAKIEFKTDVANVALRAAAIVGVMYGVGFLLMPYAMLQLSGDPGVPANPGWVRWAGGFVLGIAIGPWLASRGWGKE